MKDPTIIDPIVDSIEPLAELFIEYTHLSPEQAKAMAAGMLEFVWGADAVGARWDTEQ
jgi:hypothetical protein